MVCNLKKCTRGKAKFKAIDDLKETLESKILTKRFPVTDSQEFSDLKRLRAELHKCFNLYSVKWSPSIFYDAFLGLNR